MNCVGVSTKILSGSLALASWAGPFKSFETGLRKNPFFSLALSETGWLLSYPFKTRFQLYTQCRLPVSAEVQTDCKFIFWQGPLSYSIFTEHRLLSRHLPFKWLQMALFVMIFFKGKSKPAHAFISSGMISLRAIVTNLVSTGRNNRDLRCSKNNDCKHKNGCQESKQTAKMLSGHQPLHSPALLTEL